MSASEFERLVRRKLVQTGGAQAVFDAIKRVICPSSPPRGVEVRIWQTWRKLFADMGWMHEHLADSASRELLVSLVAMQCARDRNIELPWRGRDIVWQQSLPAPSGRYRQVSKWRLHEIDCRAQGYDLRLLKLPERPCPVFDLEQYADWASGLRVKAGDVVIDGGACWGDTALYFASLVGETGKVFAFEFDPLNVGIFRENLELNSELARRIELVQHPLWSSSGVDISFTSNGPATRVANPAGSAESHEYRSITVDELRKERRLPRVDFIKLDIEGAEPEALRGAARTIAECRPAMALCVYHCPEHYFELAKFIVSIAPDYDFTLGHMTPMEWETVLYARPRN